MGLRPLKIFLPSSTNLGILDLRVNIPPLLDPYKSNYNNLGPHFTLVAQCPCICEHPHLNNITGIFAVSLVDM